MPWAGTTQGEQPSQAFHPFYLYTFADGSGFIEPCIPTPASRPPVGPDWIHEIKHDGYRLIVRKKDGRVRLFTRRGYDWTDRYPLIREAVAGLRASALVPTSVQTRLASHTLRMYASHSQLSDTQRHSDTEP